MFAVALVNYVVPDPMQATMHAHDSTFMQFRALRSPFMHLADHPTFAMTIARHSARRGMGCLKVR